MKAARVHVTDLQKAVRLDRRRIRDAARRALRSAGAAGEVSLVYVGSAEIRDLNREYLGRDGETDVIAFPLEDDADSLLGEVIVCADVAVREARKRRRAPMEEVLLYTVHGLLHLLGYDDRTPALAREMRRKEAEILQ